MLAMDPNETVELVLQSDQGKPDPPTFKIRHLTCRERLNYHQLIRAAPSLEDEPGIDSLVEAVSMALVGWERVFDREGLAVPFNSALVVSVLTFLELWELAYGILATLDLTEADRKKSVLPSGGSTAAAN